MRYTTKFEKYIKEGAYVFASGSAQEEIRDLVWQKIINRYDISGLTSNGLLDRIYEQTMCHMLDEYETYTITFIHRKGKVPLEIQSLYDVAVSNTKKLRNESQQML